MSSSSSAHPTTDSTDDKRSPSLDWRQVVGGAGAASVVAYATSRIGPAGTIVGAAAMSVVAAITSTYLTRAARQTEQQVRKVARLKSAAASAHAPTAAENRGAQPDVALPHPEPAPTDDATQDPSQGWPWRRVAILAGVLFVVAMVVVIVVGLASGASQPTAPLAPPRTPAPTSPSESPSPMSTSPTEDAERPSPSPTATGTSTSTSTPTRTATPASTPTGAGATSTPTGGG